VLSKKEAATFGKVFTGALFLILKPFCVLIDSVATHSSTTTRYAMQLNLKNKEIETNYTIKLPNDSRVGYPNCYKLDLIAIGGIYSLEFLFILTCQTLI